MKSILSQELNNILNPAFGAGILTSFAEGYSEGKPGEPIPIPLLFFPIPMITLKEVSDCINTTYKSSGIRKMTSKLQSNTLMSLHYRLLDFRDLTLDSLSLGQNARLLLIDYDQASVHWTQQKIPHRKLPVSQKGFFSASARLGFWFSELSVHEIATTLRVNL